MNPPRSPVPGLLVTLLALAGGGAVLLAQPFATDIDPRDLQHYRFRHYWQCSFDAVSAVCGAGLLTLKRSYTSAGQWTLLALGWIGAAAYLAAALRAAQILRVSAGGAKLPPVRSVLAAFAIAQVIVLASAMAICLVMNGSSELAARAQEAIAAFASLGIVFSSTGANRWPIALISLAGIAGWPAWFLLLPALRRLFVYVHGVVTVFVAYTAVLLLGAALICALETPKLHVREGPTGPALSDQLMATRASRCAALVFSAAGAGIATEPLEDRSVSDGAKFALGLVQSLGGMGGSATGGVKWAIFSLAIAAVGAPLLGLRHRNLHPAALRCRSAAVACLASTLALTAIVAAGLLVIDRFVSSPFQSAPTFSDAFLDASSAVSAGGLSSGVFGAVTNANLSSGIRQLVDQYQYGMVWLMSAMFAGRVLPIVIFVRAARVDWCDAPTGTTPLI